MEMSYIWGFLHKATLAVCLRKLLESGEILIPAAAPKSDFQEATHMVLEQFHYGIFEVSYDLGHKHITHVRAHQMSNNTPVGGSAIYSREQVVNAIASQIKFTTLKVNNMRFELGEAVHIFPINGRKYLRTTPDNEERDNLGKLPEFNIA